MLLFVFTALAPYFLLRSFLNARTKRALDELDPRRTWLDDRPMPVLAWAAVCALVALSAIVRLGAPALPAFVVVLRGTAAIIGLSAITVLLAWGTLLCFRVDRFGWILTFLLLVGLRVATAVFLWTGGDVADLAPDAAAAAGAVARMRSVGIPPAWLAEVMSTIEALILIGFGLYVARFFPNRYRVGVLPSRTASLE
jgi:hypothetical protein